MGVVKSVTCTVKLELPVLLGVPAMAPLDERLRPDGNEPAVIVHRYGGVPPEAESVAEYGVPTMPFDSPVVVTVNVDTCDADTEIESCLVAVWAVGVVESDTCTVKLELPGLVGAPVMAPPIERVRPEGNEPEAINHL